MAEIPATQRLIEESVPGKQVTLAHVIASPIQAVYDSLGIDNVGAIGILTLSPYETAMIAADLAAKAADVTVGFLDRFTGSVVVLGDVQSVTEALTKVCQILHDDLGFDVCEITRT
ncbi:BMC domain-containing protein [Lacticaseibacillus baoqingensis]|uniref:BMC domain-containing protein n=1 Tax=Lacticaseibacillus baoqingensis TaxID=2486013 RepID=A0ABW4ECB1_9LACO|nr:BMC domain-containing protein [Lacticaseibacillus baoqingensis]